MTQLGFSKNKYRKKKKKRHIWRQDHRAECLLYTEGAEDKAPQSVAPESILPPLLQEPLLSGAHSAHHAPQVLQRLHRPHRLLKDTAVCRGPCFFKFYILFLDWPGWVSVAARSFSSSRGEQRLPSGLRGFSLPRLLLLPSVGSRLQAQELWCMGLAAPLHVGSSWTGTEAVFPLASGFFTTELLRKPW